MLATGGALALTGCVGDTDRATSVRANQAQLNAHGHTTNGPAYWWWEYGISRNLVANGGGTKTPRNGAASSAVDVSLNTVVKNLERTCTAGLASITSTAGPAPTSLTSTPSPSTTCSRPAASRS